MGTTSGLTGRKEACERVVTHKAILSPRSLSSSRGHTSFLKAEEPQTWCGFNRKDTGLGFGESGSILTLTPFLSWAGASSLALVFHS